ncbi:carbonic anhydrase [Streptomyces sp. KR80]|uniref:carbonic anhydrase n=1 Tax=Streptomyces sp. KR80 TaxID=3457426 RepID=UPI003FD29716
MKEILEQARSFRQRLGAESENLRRHAAGQTPEALFITCSDSRVIPALITAARPGQLFELRNAGNIVPPYRPGIPSGEAATIEYAVEVLQVPDIVVCGHSHCGAVGALARGEDLTRLPGVADWLTFAQPGLTPLPATPPENPALSEIVQRHVAAQVRALCEYPQVERRIAAGQLRVHGWFYRVDTGEVQELETPATTCLAGRAS